MAVFFFVLLCVLLLLMGRVVYGKHTQMFTFLKVGAHFVVQMVTNALFFAMVVAFFTALLGLVIWLLPDVQADAIIEGQEHLTDKFPTVTVLFFLLIVIFLVALLQVGAQRWVTRRFPRLTLSQEEFEISEYLIQWLTIYVVVYQMLFDSLKSLGALLPQITNWQASFEVLLSPSNINAVIQPLLIATWVAIVLEKLSARHSQIVTAADPSASPTPADDDKSQQPQSEESCAVR